MKTMSKEKSAPSIIGFIFLCVLLVIVCFILSIFYRIERINKIDTHYLFWFIPIFKKEIII